MVDLKNVELLSSLSESEVDFLNSISQKRSLKSGEILFNKGDEASAVYILLEGRLEAFVPGETEDIVLGTIEAEDIVGEMGLLSENKRRMASIRSVEDSIVLVILPFAIENLKQNHPEIIGKILNIVEERKKINKQKLKV